MGILYQLKSKLNLYVKKLDNLKNKSLIWYYPSKIEKW